MAIKSLLSRWQKIILITASIRIFIFIFTVIAYEKNISNFTTLWTVWDSNWYLAIAKDWYQQSGETSVAIVFYPLYPLLIKFTSFFLNDLSLSALLVSFLFTIFASILLFELTLLDFSKKVATKTVLFMNIFPTSYFFQAIYPESLFLTISLLYFLLLRKGEIFSMGLSGALATLTRVNGLTLLPLLFIENKNTLNKSVFTFLIASSGFAIYLLINFWTFGNFFQFAEILKSYWFKYIDWPWNGISGTINLLSFYRGDYLIAYSFELPTILLLFAVGIFAFLKIRKSYGVYVLINAILFTSTSFILSTPRYALVLFPIFIALAMIKNKIITVILIVSFVSLLCYFSYVFTQGRWAF